MKIALGWLRQMVPTQAAAEEVAHRLTMGGLEVEDVTRGPVFSQVVVARVERVERHPGADRLSVCQVDTGGPQVRTLVCGAPNVAAGLLVPCALPGAELPGGMQIKVSAVRGVRSEGMLCSARELGLSEDAQGLLVLDADAVPGMDLRAWLQLDDPVFEFKTTPNRGDCLSALGVARELAALGAEPLVPPPIDPVPVSSQESLSVQVDAPELCGRFSGRVVRGLDARAATPAWMRRRLEQCGQRPISALVDISNFVMLERGQPSHVFDLNRIRGGLMVRWGHEGERVELLNGQTVELDGQIGVVADASGPLAVAGIMGGLSSSVTLDTTDVYLEAAFWWPESIQGRARRLNFSSEASHRFERGVDFARTTDAIERLTQLIVEVCGTAHTRVGPVDDHILRLPPRAPVQMRLARLQRVLGIAIEDEEARDALERLGLPCELAGGALRVTPPSFRFDLEREEDLIEEVARVHGYDRIPAEPPLARARMRARPETHRGAHDLRLAMAQAGYQELVNFSFVPEFWEADFGADTQYMLHVINPIASQHGVMRSGLAASLAANLRYNLNRQATRVRTFELARVFRREKQQGDGPFEVAGIAQPLHLAALAFGPVAEEQWGIASRPADFFDIKGDLETLLHPGRARFEPPAASDPGFAALHPGRSACVLLDGRRIGWIGELHPRVCQSFELPTAPVLLEIEVAPLLVCPLPVVGEVPRFPSLVRDIAMWMDEKVPAGEVLQDLRALAAGDPALDAVREISLFDVFRPRAGAASESGLAGGASGLLNKDKSLAFRIVLQDTQRSLEERDADAARATIAEHLMRRWGGRERR
jgi:phenylalanyl-tRNA synthetase beta chain